MCWTTFLQQSSNIQNGENGIIDGDGSADDEIEAPRARLTA